MQKQQRVSLNIYPNITKKSAKTGKYPVYLKLTYDGKKVETRLPKEVDLTSKEFHDWDSITRRVRTKTCKLNSYLNTIETNWEKYMVLNNYVPKNSLNDIVALITEKVMPSRMVTVLSFLETFLKEKVDGDATKSNGTKVNYHKAAKHFKAFLKKEKLEHLLVTDFKYIQADKFNLYMNSPEGADNSPVSSSTNVRRIKSVFEEAIRHEIITKNPFSGIKIVLKSGNKTASLTINQINSILTCEKLKPFDGLAFYRDVYLFFCFTGLSFVDYFNLDSEVLFPIFDGRFKLDTMRKKTGKVTVMVVPKPAQKIMEKYFDFSSGSSGLIFPRVT